MTSDDLKLISEVNSFFSIGQNLKNYRSGVKNLLRVKIDWWVIHLVRGSKLNISASNLRLTEPPSNQRRSTYPRSKTRIIFHFSVDQKERNQRKYKKQILLLFREIFTRKPIKVGHRICREILILSYGPLKTADSSLFHGIIWWYFGSIFGFKTSFARP